MPSASGVAVWKHSCERPHLANGRMVRTARKSATGHMFKYRCRRGYRRLGNMFNICLRGRWVLEHAVCASESTIDGGDVSLVRL